MDDCCGVKSFDCLNKAFKFIKDHEKATSCRYSVSKSTNWNYESINVNIPTLKPYKIRWQDKQSVPNLPFDGAAFVILGTQVRQCIHGIDAARKKKMNPGCVKNSNAPKISTKRVDLTEKASTGSSDINQSEDSGFEFNVSGYNDSGFRLNDSDIETYVILNDECGNGLYDSDILNDCETLQVMDNSGVKVCELRTINEDYVVVVKDSDIAKDLNKEHNTSSVLEHNTLSVLDSQKVLTEKTVIQTNQMKVNVNDSNLADIKDIDIEDSNNPIMSTQPKSSSVFTLDSTISAPNKSVIDSLFPSPSTSISSTSTANSNSTSSTGHMDSDCQQANDVLKYCSACVKIRVILQFPEYTIPELNYPKWKKEALSRTLVAQFSPETKRKLKVYIYLPSLSEHTNHLTGRLAYLHEERERLVRERVSDFVKYGVRKFKDVRESMQDFLDLEISPKFTEISPDFPVDRIIKNEIQRTVHKERLLHKKSKLVLENVSADDSIMCGNKELVDEIIMDDSFLNSHDYCQEEVAYSRTEACFSTEEEANEFIKKHEIETNCTYSLRSIRKRAQLESLNSLEKFCLRWGDAHVWPNIPRTGVPYIIVATQLRRCQHGPLQTRSEKIVKEMLHFKGKTRKKQESMKKGCMAYLKVRTIIRFPEYQISKDSNKHEREKISRLLWKNFSVATEKKLEVYVSLPPLEDHSNHATGELANHSQRPDKMVIEKIHEVVGYGVTNVKEMQVHLKIFFDKEILPMYPEASSKSRRFNPTDRDIRNHIKLAKQKFIATNGYDPFPKPSPVKSKVKHEKQRSKKKKTLEGYK